MEGYRKARWKATGKRGGRLPESEVWKVPRRYKLLLLQQQNPLSDTLLQKAINDDDDYEEEGYFYAVLFVYMFQVGIPQSTEPTNFASYSRHLDIGHRNEPSPATRTENAF